MPETVEQLAERLERLRTAREEAEIDRKIRELQEKSSEMDAYKAQLKEMISACDVLPASAARLPAAPKSLPVLDGQRVVLLVDRDNRGQKFLDGVTSIPEHFTVHVVYNPSSKHPFNSKPAGDVRYHPALTNEKECNASVMALVAGEVSVEEDPQVATIYFVFCDEHEGRHEEVIERMRHDGFFVETCSSWQYSITDVLGWHGLDPDHYGGESFVDIRHVVPANEPPQQPMAPTTRGRQNTSKSSGARADQPPMQRTGQWTGRYQQMQAETEGDVVFGRGPWW